MALLRSLAFYLAFYFGSVFHVLVSLAWIPIDRRRFRATVRAWSQWHRFCVTHILGIEVRCEGGPLAEPMLYAVKHEAFFEAIDTPALFLLPAVFAKQELFAIPGWGRTAATFGLIPVERSAAPGRFCRALQTRRTAGGAGRGR